MTLRRLTLTLLAASGLLFAGLSPTVADEKQESAKAAALKKRAKEIFGRAIKKHRAAKSYMDSFTTENRMIAKDADGGDANEETKEEGSLHAALPNKLAFRSSMFQIISDGKKLWVAAPDLGEYTESEAPKTLDLSDALTGPLAMMPIVHPVLDALASQEEDLWALYPNLGDVTAIATETRGGRKNHRVEITTTMPMMPNSEPAKLSVWIDAESSQLSRISFDYTAGFQKMVKEMGGMMQGGPASIEKAETVFEFKNVKLGSQISDNVFAFTPADGMKKVDEFSGPGGGMDEKAQQKLVNKPAPQWTSEDFDGKAVKLSDFKGKVVLMDFWATWCGPCVQAIPHIQKLSEKMKDKPVVVLGINQDRKGSEKQVKKFMKKKKLTFRQVKDFDNKIGGAYKVMGIPCTVLIDKDGVLRAVHVGFMPGSEKELEKQIERLLKGETL